MPSQIDVDDDVEMDTPPEQKSSSPEAGSEQGTEVLEVEEDAKVRRESAEEEESKDDSMNGESRQYTPDHSEDDTAVEKDEKAQRGSHLKIFEEPPAFHPSSIKVSKEFSELKQMISLSSDEAVQAVLREHWKKFLFGEEEDAPQATIDDHVSFILRIGVTNASEDVLELFAASASKSRRFVSHALTNTTSDQIDAYVAPEILEPILRDRLKSIPAMQLIQWLAEAERLGYSADDIMENDDESLVMPNLPGAKFTGHADHEDDKEDVPMQNNHSLGEGQRQQPQIVQQAVQYQPPKVAHYQTQNNTPPVVQYRSPLPSTPLSAAHSRPNSNGTPPHTCANCRRVLPTAGGYDFHVAKKVCLRAAPPGGWKGVCKNCGQGFTTKQGHDYHDMKNVCYGNTASPSAPPSSAVTPSHQGANPQIPRPSYNQAASIPSPAYSPPPNSSQARAHPTARPAFNPVRNPAIPALSTPRFVSETPSQAGSQGSSGGPRRQAYADSPETRIAPDALPPAKLAELNKKLADIDYKYETDCATVRNDPNMSEVTKQQKLTSLKNGCASRKSQTRKSFGVTLRLRDKDKKFMKQQGLQTGYKKTPVSTGVNHYVDPRSEPSRRASSGSVNPPPEQTKPLLKYATPPPPTAVGGFTPLNRPGVTPPIVASVSTQRARRESGEKLIGNVQGIKRQRTNSRSNDGEDAIMVISSDEDGAGGRTS
ncbi:hypothetical protein BP6252_01068 [Coleophoma cylindrospora]|uniref:Uncharacterized protein n=1 Tax=Coleophoma cylindrospora TaxID=1849047 RepID=A0A3D8SRU9_9HELO|nr:hypothetical protein BP6252_01068 [Coleophoma cylindrospora]